MPAARAKVGKKLFMSVIPILMKAGNTAYSVKLQHGLGNLFKSSELVWFPGLQIMVRVDNNSVIQLQNHEGMWIVRKGRKNGWYQASSLRGGPQFVALIEPHYVKYLNELMTGETDVP